MADSHPVWRGAARRAVHAFIVLVTALAVCGAVYEIAGARQESQRFPQIGRSVKAAGYMFNLNCSGTGRPTVVLDSGLGLSSLGWSLIQPEIAKYARVCSFDRPGYGWSDAARGPRTSLQIAKNLKALLDAADERGPFILVGPSFGGFNVRVYTGLFPKDVGGLVFLDASHEDQQSRIDEIVPAARNQRIKAEQEERRANDFALMEARITIPLGIERLYRALNQEKPQPAFGLSGELIGEFDYLDRQLKTREVVAAESAGMLESGRQAKAAGSLGDRPSIVITGGKMEFSPDPLFTAEIQDRLRNLWINVLQTEEARLSTRGRQIVLKDSGHIVQFERPDAVIDAVHQVWIDVRATMQ